MNKTKETNIPLSYITINECPECKKTAPLQIIDNNKIKCLLCEKEFKLKNEKNKETY